MHAECLCAPPTSLFLSALLKTFFLKVFFASSKHLFSMHGSNGHIVQKYIDLVTFIKPDEQPVLSLGVSLVVPAPLALLRGSGDG